MKQLPKQNHLTNFVLLSRRDTNELPRRKVVTTFLIFAAIIAFSFFFRHVAGIIVTHGSYNPLTYNPVEVRVIPPPHYDFLPDDVVWDETRVYARSTEGFLRGERDGPVFVSYAPYIQGTTAQAPKFYRDGLGQLVLSWMARIPGSSVPSAFCAADFIFVFALTLALLCFCWELRPSLPFVIIAATAVTLYNWQDMQNFAEFLGGGIQNSSFILRTPYPQFSLTLTFLFFIFLKRLAEKPNYRLAALLTLSITLNFYAYFYSWTFVCATLFATLGFLLISFLTPWNLFGTNRDIRRDAFWMLVVSGMAALALTAPVWRGVIRKSPDVLDSFRRINGEFTHQPNMKYTAVLGALLLGSMLARWKHFEIKWIFPVLFVAGLGVMNLQVAAGKTIQSGHWSSYYIQPLVTIALLQILWPFAESLSPRLVTGAITLLVVAGIGMNLVKFWKAAVEMQHFDEKDPVFEEVIDRLNSPELAKYGFVTNDFYVATVLPAYVRLKPLMPTYMDAISDMELSQLRMAAVHATGFKDWVSFSRATGQGGVEKIGIPEIQYKFDRVLLVMNKHREIPEAGRNGRCEVLSNRDFVVLKPCLQ